MAEERIVLLDIRVGTNGSGKSHQAKRYLDVRPRNLVLPANRSDRMWHGIKELVPVKKFRLDPNDPKRKRQKPYWHIPELNTFRGNRVVHCTEDGVFEAIIDKDLGFRNGGLFIDDTANRIQSTGQLTNKMKTFFGDRRMHMIDIHLASWRFQDINAEIYGFNPRIFVFNVTGPPNTHLKEKMVNFDEMIATWKRVRAVNEGLPETKKWHFELFKPA